MARTAAGEWIIVELGDGQVSGLPEALDPVELFGCLRDRLDGRSGEE